MISHVYLSAVLMFTALPSVCSQCTTSRCQDSKYEPPRWENGAVYLESLLTVTSERILSAVESRLIELTENMATSHAQLTASIESRLARHAEAVDDRLSTLKTELEHSTTSRLEALEERMAVESRYATINSVSRLNLTIGAMMNNMESRLAEQSATIERRLADQTTTIASRLAQLTEAVDERQATLKTDLDNTSTDRLEALKERMVVINRNLANNSESRLNLTIGAMINNMETALTALCSSQGSDQMTAAVYNMSNAQLQILRMLESRGQVTFLRRVDGSVNFTRNWADYKSGFGNDNEFWLGLEKLHQLSTQHEYGLRVDMEDFSGERKWALYRSFSVGNESGKYVLTVTGYRPDSTAGDSMTYHSYMKFSTSDRDNDWAAGNCATSYKSGWWYNSCARCKPTGLYKPAGYRDSDGITWKHAYGDYRSFKSMSLKLVRN